MSTAFLVPWEACFPSPGVGMLLFLQVNRRHPWLRLGSVILREEMHKSG
jgi:hypothetical protein